MEVKKRKIREWFIEVGQICKKIFCHKLNKWGGVKCEDYSISTILIGTFIISLLIGSGVGIGAIYISNFTSSMSAALSRILPSYQSTPIVLIPDDNNSITPDDNPIDLSDGCNLILGQWDLWFGNMSRDVKDDTSYYFLNINEGGGLFKYSENISTSTDCVFKFIPRGDQVINYVISFDNFYQVVIGDNDYQTVSLRASEVMGGKTNPISELKTGKVRPKLSSVIKEGSLVTVTLQQNQTEINKYEVIVSIMYISDSFEENETKTEDFVWQFVPSPILELSPLELSIGLIRGYGDKSNIGVNFISPAPNKTQ